MSGWAFSDDSRRPDGTTEAVGTAPSAAKGTSRRENGIRDEGNQGYEDQ